MVELLQIFVLENHSAYLCPKWPNTMEFEDTNGSFGTISLHDTNLHSVIENLALDFNKIKLTSDQKYMANSMGVKLPFFQSSQQKSGDCIAHFP